MKWQDAGKKGKKDEKKKKRNGAKGRYNALEEKMPVPGIIRRV